MCACVYLSGSLCARARSVWYTLKWVITSLLRQINVRLTHRKLDHFFFIKHHHDLKRECVWAWVGHLLLFLSARLTVSSLREGAIFCNSSFQHYFWRSNAAALLLQKQYMYIHIYMTTLQNYFFRNKITKRRNIRSWQEARYWFTLPLPLPVPRCCCPAGSPAPLPCPWGLPPTRGIWR